MRRKDVFRGDYVLRCKGSGLGRRAICGEGRNDLLEGLIVQVVGRPTRDLLCLNLLAKLYNVRRMFQHGLWSGEAKVM